jgi:hypothetical protein
MNASLRARSHRDYMRLPTVAASRCRVPVVAHFFSLRFGGLADRDRSNEDNLQSPYSHGA